MMKQLSVSADTQLLLFISIVTLIQITI